MKSTQDAAAQSQIRDVFEPVNEPARTLYLTFQEEAALRKGRPVEVWTRREVEVVFEKAQELAASMGLRAPSLEEVEALERYARGSVDYGAKWAHRIAEAMRSPAPSERRSS